MTLTPSLKDAMLGAVPSLRAFAISLSGNIDRADDLVQETLLRAIANIELVPARHQHVGLDVHDPAQPVPLGIPQAPP